MINLQLKPIVWLGNSIDIVRDWPMATGKRAGEELYRLQIGSEPLHWRGMKSVGRGVKEIKISESGEHRVFYVVRRDEGIVVLHAFEKKTQRTAKSDIDLGKKRLKSGEYENVMAGITRGNVFEDLGFSPVEAERMALQVFLGEQIRAFINRNKLSQAKAAAFFGIQQPKISKILNENLDGMSIDYLVKLVAQTGGTLKYSFRQPRKLSPEEIELRVAAA